MKISAFCKLNLICLMLLPLSSGANENQKKLAKIERLNNFILASCNREHDPQPLWDFINADKPELFIWGGDNIYGDKKPYKDNLELKYKVQNEVLGYKKLKNSTPIIGIWDDHDFGANNGGQVADKVKNKELFFQFIEEPKQSTRRLNDGVYTSYEFGQEGQQAKFIMLDIRYNQSVKSLLSEKQWEWLENELKNTKAQINFIQSGIPFTTPPIIRTEEWADYRSSQQRLFELIKKYNVPGVVFLSGDKHFSALIHRSPYIEFMSSGMTHRTLFFLRPFLRYHFPYSYYDLNYMQVKILWDKNPLQIQALIKGRGIIAIQKTYELVNQQFQKLE